MALRFNIELNKNRERSKSMAYDYRKLCARIVEIFGTQASFATAMGKSERTISLKLNNKVDWSQDEMTQAAGLLKFELESIPDYFFVLRVQS